MPTVLYPPTIDWDFMFQRPQQIMRQFAKNGWKVIYCAKHQRAGVPLKEVEPNIFICTDLPGFIHEGNKVDVFYSTWAKCVDLAGVIPNKLVIYDRIDDFAEWEAYEKTMIDRADIVLASSHVLYEKTVDQNSNKDIYHVPNACDFAHFHNATTEVPYLHELPKPILGFVGALGSWIDRSLLNWCAANYATLIVGLEFGVPRPPRGIFLGQKSYTELPTFYRSIDIGVIPFDSGSRVAKAANPIKMYEYLASGKPVLATSTRETEQFPGHVYTIDWPTNLHEYLAWILDQETEAKKLERMQLAKKNTWEKRFEIIEREIKRRL